MQLFAVSNAFQLQNHWNVPIAGLGFQRLIRASVRRIAVPKTMLRNLLIITGDSFPRTLLSFPNECGCSAGWSLATIINVSRETGRRFYARFPMNF